MTISENDLAKARQDWGDGLVAISKAYEAGGIEKARPTAQEILDNLYGYDLGPVLFKPTMASGDKTFRPTRDGALSYFVGHNDEYPNDGGFGIKGWRKMESETSAQFIRDDVAMWMGWVILTDRDDQITKVDKSFGYQKCSDGRLRIVLHHSSLPYMPDPTG